MNREIKFRGKSINSEKWLYGYLGEAKSKILQSIYKEKVIFENLEWFNTDNFGYVVNDYMVDEETIGQYTGLKDKNDKEIYEGDILRVIWGGNEFACLVGWNYGIGAWCISIGDTHLGVEPLGGWLSDGQFEVIGNIHDNKELLNQE